MQAEVANALLDIEAVGFTPQKPVTFKSGILSPVYVDNRRLIYHPAQWQIIVEGFRELIENQHITFDVVAGIETAGIPHSSALAYILKKPSVFVRKEAKGHGKKKRVEGGDVTEKRVLLIEDLVTTGGSSLAGVEALRNEGALVKDCLTIVSYEFDEAKQAFDAAKVRLHALTSFGFILNEALKRGQFSQKEMGMVEDWLRDPIGWGSRHGFRQ